MDNPVGEGRRTVSLTVNGRQERVDVGLDTTLLHALREQLGLTSVRGACGLGLCGSCTVLVDDKAVSSCLLLAVMVDGANIESSEGLASGDGQLSAVQELFVKHSAYQCSYCIPGMVVGLEGWLREDGPKDMDQCVGVLSGHLCRCGTYPQVLDAVRELLGGDAEDGRAT